jgi:hypothetical protein
MRHPFLTVSIATACLFAAAAGYAVSVKNTIQPASTLEQGVENDEQISFLFYPIEQSFMIYPNTFDQLMEESDAVVTVSTDDWGALSAHCTLRTCSVLHDLKGTVDVSQIYVYEPITSNGGYTSEMGYVPMIPGKEYMLFLKHSEGYDQSSDAKIKNGYYPANYFYGKYSRESSEPVLISDNETMSFSTLLQYSAIADQQADLDRYQLFAEQCRQFFAEIPETN